MDLSFPGATPAPRPALRRQPKPPDGMVFFVWEPVWGVDAWVSLTAAAMQTGRIRLGTMLTPLSRMRPWKLASETATLDNLSNGRVTLAVGLGSLGSGFEAFGEVTERRTRAELLDEGLDILTGLWRGQPFNYEGKHYHVKETSFILPPPPVQQPRIPIWVVGAWPYEKSMQRALRYDGLLPSVIHTDKNGERQPAQAGIDDVRQISAYIRQHRETGEPFDIIVEGETPGNKPAKARQIVQDWAGAGATWWIEAMWSAPTLEKVLERIHQGPPGEA